MDGASVTCILGEPWALLNGTIEAPITLGWLHLEELPGKDPQGS